MKKVNFRITTVQGFKNRIAVTKYLIKIKLLNV